ncbi:MAG: hypothetical protein ACE5H4_07310 [Candidatus Thorarchaeota archaeon]
MTVCIIAVIAVSALSVAAISYLGSEGWTWNPIWTPDGPKTTFYSDAEVGATTGTVTLEIDLTTGGIALDFEDNVTLLYRIEVEVYNSTIDVDGEPDVTFSANTIGLDYTTGGATVVLGTGVDYNIDLLATTGGIDVDLENGARIGNVSLTATTGGIDLKLNSDVDIVGDVHFDVETSTGAINAEIALPVGVEGSFVAATSTGGVLVSAPGWNAVLLNHYETPNYDVASKRITIIAQAATGGISANLG